MNFLKLALIFTVLFFRIYANEAFYAVSSLRFLLDAQENKSILFEAADLDRLWEKAEQVNSITNDIQIARLLYDNQADHPEVLERLVNAWDNIRREDDQLKTGEETRAYPHFSDNYLMNDEIRQTILPYLLPLHHAMKPQLDLIFSHSRAIENEKAFLEAGFKSISNYMRVARHSLLPGYLLKVFLDDEKRLKQSKRPGWQRLVDRCEGAMNIRKLIKKEKIQYFVVPDKFIYPLPISPSPMITLNGREQQLAVLLVTDMELVPHEECRHAWKNKITHKHLEELYLIISHGYASTYLAANIAYTKNGKFACIDTEFPQRKLHFEKVRHYLSEEMCVYWDELVRKGGHHSSLKRY